MCFSLSGRENSEPQIYTDHTDNKFLICRICVDLWLKLLARQAEAFGRFPRSAISNYGHLGANLALLLASEGCLWNC